ncbi:integrase, catalytic region, zinc finger, CCHC-type containing protein [Tanacetum coccineum]
MYKERVRILEGINKDNNYLNEFLEADKRAKHYNKQAQSQLVRDRDIIRDLEKQRDKLDLDVKNYKRKNEELQKTHSILKRQMSEKEDTYHDTILDLEAKLKKNVELILKFGNPLQGMFMLGPKPLSKVIQNGNSKKRISTGKDGVVRILPPVSPAEIHAVEKERKARTMFTHGYSQGNICEDLRGLVDAKEIWKAIRTRFGGNANSKKMQKAVLKQQFKRDPFYQDQGAGKKEQKQNCLLIMDDGVVNWGEHTKAEETNHALMAISSSNEVSLCSKTCIDSYNKLKTLCDEQTNQLGDQEAQILAYSQAVKKLEAQLENRNESCKRKGTIAENIRFMEYCFKNLWRLLILHELSKDSVGKPLYSRFTKTNDFKGVPHPLSGDYTPTPQEEIDESLYVYGKKGPQEPEPNVSDDRSSEYSTCQSNDSAGSIGTSSEHSVDLESEISRGFNHANQFVPRPVQLNAGRSNINSVRPNINTGRTNINSVRPNINTGRTNINSVRPNINTASLPDLNTALVLKKTWEIGELLLRPQMLERGSYIPWASRFRRYLNRKRDNRKWLLKALDECPYEFKNFVPEGSTIPRLQTAKDLEGDDLLLHDAEMEVMNMILLSIPNEIYNSVDACTSAKDMWKRVERLMRGTIQNKVNRETRFTNEFNQFVAKPGEALVSVYNRFAQLMNDLERNNMNFPTLTINTKFLNSLQPKWLKYVTQVLLVKQLTVDSFDDLFDYLQQFKKLVKASRAKKLEKSHDPLALVANTGSYSRQTPSYYVTHPKSVVDYDDEYKQDDVHHNSEDSLVSAMLVNIQSRNSGNTGRNNRRAYVQEEVVEGMNAPNETGNVQRTLRTPSSGNTSTVQCYNCSGKGHYARNCPKPRVRDSKYFMEQMLLAKQDEAGVILTDEQNDFLFADASRMEEIEELSANICLMARIQPADHTSDDGPSCESAFISEVQSSSIDENNEQMYPTHTKIINSTIGNDQINSNIKFDSFKGSVNSGSVEKDTHVPDLCAIEKLARNAYQEAEKQQIFAQQVQKQNTHLTSQLEMYKERVRILESINKDNNYLNEFLEADERAKRYNKQAQSQLVRDRDIIRDLEKQRDKLDLDVKNYKRKNEELQKTHSILKRQMSEKEDTYHDTILDLEAKLKKNVDLILKLGNSLQGMFMLGPKPLSVYDQQLKHGLGYPNPYTLKQAISKCPKLYVASSLGNLEIPLNVRDSEDTLEDAFKSQQKMTEKMNDPIAVANKQNCWTINYKKLNALYKDFVPQKELSVEQKYFPSSSIPSVKIPVSKNMPSESPLIKELDKIKVCFEKLSLLIQQNCKRASIFYTSPAEIQINDFCQDQVKPILNELKVYLEFFRSGSFVHLSQNFSLVAFTPSSSSRTTLHLPFLDGTWPRNRTH